MAKKKEVLTDVVANLQTQVEMLEKLLAKKEHYIKSLKGQLRNAHGVSKMVEH